MNKAILFHPSDEELDMLNLTRERSGITTLTMAVKYLLRKGYFSTTREVSYTDSSSSVKPQTIGESNQITSSAGRPSSRAGLIRSLLSAPLREAEIKAKDLNIFPDNHFLIKPYVPDMVINEGLRTKGIQYKYSFEDLNGSRYVRKTYWDLNKNDFYTQYQTGSADGETHPWEEEPAETFLKRRIKELGL